MIPAGLTQGGKFVLGAGRFSIIVDTGFSGDLALPRPILKRLKLRYAGPIDYQLADGTVQTMDQWAGSVLVDRYEYRALFIEGAWLVGMDFLQDVARTLKIDFNRGELALTLRR